MPSISTPSIPPNPNDILMSMMDGDKRKR